MNDIITIETFANGKVVKSTTHIENQVVTTTTEVIKEGKE